MFRDREEAAILLSLKLEKYKGKNGIILAVPRGGIPIGSIVAERLKLPLDIVLSKKIGHPNQPELAVGSVTLDDRIIDPRFEIPMSYIESETIRIRNLLEERYKNYLGDHAPLDLKNKIVIVVDDGIATGSTMIVTISQNGGPEKLSPRILYLFQKMISSAKSSTSKLNDEIMNLKNRI